MKGVPIVAGVAVQGIRPRRTVYEPQQNVSG